MARPTLEEIFHEPDPWGLLDVKPTVSSKRTADQKDREVLCEIERFYELHGRLPDSGAKAHDEMRLGTILVKLQNNNSDALKHLDKYKLLNKEVCQSQKEWCDETWDTVPSKSLDDIFADSELEADLSLSTLNYSTPAHKRVVSPDYMAEVVPCRDFQLFAPKFEEVQTALERGERKARLIRKGTEIEPLEGDFFIRNGLLALIVEKTEKTVRSGSRDHRLRIVFSNGTESDPLMSSFRKSLSEDKTARRIDRIGLGPVDPDWDTGQPPVSGTIYVARSLSDDPVIKEQRDILYKIGVTSQNVRRRIADARNDPTFLLAPVEIVATFSLKNFSRQKVEDLLHRFFETARAKITIQDRFGKKIYPKEWFYVLPEQIGQAAKLILDGELHLYCYDRETQKIIRKSNKNR